MMKMNNPAVLAFRSITTPTKLKHICATISASLTSLLSFLIFHANPFWIELIYFTTLSTLGFLSLKVSKPRTPLPPKNIDLFFTSSSATTLSSLSTVDMEVFSNPQLIFMIFMMFSGGEVFTSLLGLQLDKLRMIKRGNTKMLANNEDDNIELGRVFDRPTPMFKEEAITTTKPYVDDGDNNNNNNNNDETMKLKLIRSISIIVLCFLLLVPLMGTIAIFLYLVVTPSARRVLTGKNLHLGTFSIFTSVSSFANCGFIPTNENMVVFKRNSGLLLLVALQILMGNTFYPVCLRGVIWALEKITRKKEFGYILENSEELGYGHLLTGMRTAYLGVTGLGFLVLQLATFCSMEWNSPATAGGGGLSGYQKLVGSFFQVVNSRHAGESVFDLASISSAVLVLFVLMIAYGNVGFSTGYSCARQIMPDGHCIDASYGFSGRWTNQGKFVLIIVMFYGRLKKYSMNGGRAWSLQ